MSFNNGAGPADGETCKEIASRFHLWMEHNASGHSVSLKELGVAADEFDNEPYNIDDNTLKEWVDFLEHCGGFSVG